MSQEFEEQLIRSRYSQSKGDKTTRPARQTPVADCILRKGTIRPGGKDVSLAVPPLRAPAFFA